MPICSIMMLFEMYFKTSTTQCTHTSRHPNCHTSFLAHTYPTQHCNSNAHSLLEHKCSICAFTQHNACQALKDTPGIFTYAETYRAAPLSEPLPHLRSRIEPRRYMRQGQSHHGFKTSGGVVDQRIRQDKGYCQGLGSLACVMHDPIGTPPAPPAPSRMAIACQKINPRAATQQLRNFYLQRCASTGHD